GFRRRGFAAIRSDERAANPKPELPWNHSTESPHHYPSENREEDNPATGCAGAGSSDGESVHGSGSVLVFARTDRRERNSAALRRVNRRDDPPRGNPKGGSVPVEHVPPGQCLGNGVFDAGQPDAGGSDDSFGREWNEHDRSREQCSVEHRNRSCEFAEWIPEY